MERSERLDEYAGQVLSADEFAEMAVPMQTLVSSHPWSLFAEVLKRYRIQAREGFEAVEDMAGVAYTKGLIAGLLLAEKVPAEVLRGAEERVRRAEREEKGQERRDMLTRDVLRPGGEESF